MTNEMPLSKAIASADTDGVLSHLAFKVDAEPDLFPVIPEFISSRFPAKDLRLISGALRARGFYVCAGFISTIAECKAHLEDPHRVVEIISTLSHLAPKSSFVDAGTKLLFHLESLISSRAKKDSRHSALIACWKIFNGKCNLVGGEILGSLTAIFEGLDSLLDAPGEMSIGHMDDLRSFLLKGFRSLPPVGSTHAQQAAGAFRDCLVLPAISQCELVAWHFSAYNNSNSSLQVRIGQGNIMTLEARDRIDFNNGRFFTEFRMDITAAMLSSEATDGIPVSIAPSFQGPVFGKTEISIPVSSIPMRILSSRIDKLIFVKIRDDLSGKPLLKAPQSINFSELNAYSGEHFIEKAYQMLLHKSPDAAGLKYYADQLRSGTIPKESIIRQILSNEPDSGAIVTGLNRIDVSLADLEPLNGEAFVKEAYRRLLFKPVDQQGLAHYLAIMSKGTAKKDVLREIADSEDGRKIGVQVVGLA